MNIFLESVLSFAKIGTFTLGGGYAMIPLIEKEVVEKKKWLTQEEFLDSLALAQSTPGILAVNIAIFVGHKLKGIGGSIMTTLGAILPSFVMILLIALCFTNIKDNHIVQAVFKGVRPAVVALIAIPVFNMAKTAKITWKTVAIPIAAALIIWQLDISPILVILLAGIGGFAYGKISEKK